MIVITGAAGFVGSCLVSFLNQEGYTNLLLVDNFSDTRKAKNLEGKIFTREIERDVFLDWFNNNHNEIDFVFHIGARTDTTEQDHKIFDELNFNYTKRIWEICSKAALPLVYASSAATYGIGEYGYTENEANLQFLAPLNPYAVSKNQFDKWAIQQTATNAVPSRWYGLKFFNVYGPNEYHKSRMASVIFHAYNQMQNNGVIKLFRSHKAGIKDGEQMRDFVYVKDVCKVCFFILQNQSLTSGIYNLGSGTARTFIDLATNTFAAVGQKPNIQFIDTPQDIRNSYQYFTQADMNKLKNAGYNENFYSLEQGIFDYVQNYLAQDKYF